MVEEAAFIDSDDAITLKKALAKSLYGKKLDQSKISDILEISQPMVSNYIGSKEQISKRFLDLAEEISNKIIDNKSAKFHTCIIFSEKPFEGSFFIANKNEIISEQNRKVIDNLAEAFSILKGKNIGGLMPEVKINIAMAKENAETSEDVAGFLNGLVIVDDKITGYNGIRFGKSRHLSSLLLDLKNKFDINAIMNIAYVENIKKTDLKTDYLTKDYKLKNSKKQVDVLLHKGDFGIEPCAYILGKDAKDVSKKLLKIIDGNKHGK